MKNYNQQNKEEKRKRALIYRRKVAADPELLANKNKRNRISNRRCKNEEQLIAMLATRLPEPQSED